MSSMIPIGIAAMILRKLLASRTSVSLNLVESEATEERQESLCRTCRCSLIRKSGDGEEFTSCTFGGKMIPVEFEVTECSGFEDRCVERPAKTAGFIKPGRAVRDNVTVIRIACGTEH